jgi:5S rRNA maturation endonuclease (ribonuclease M5)
MVCAAKGAGGALDGAGADSAAAAAGSSSDHAPAAAVGPPSAPAPPPQPPRPAASTRQRRAGTLLLDQEQDGGRRRTRRGRGTQILDQEDDPPAAGASFGSGQTTSRATKGRVGRPRRRSSTAVTSPAAAGGVEPMGDDLGLVQGRGQPVLMAAAVVELAPPAPAAAATSSRRTHIEHPTANRAGGRRRSMQYSADTDSVSLDGGDDAGPPPGQAAEDRLSNAAERMLDLQMQQMAPPAPATPPPAAAAADAKQGQRRTRQRTTSKPPPLPPPPVAFPSAAALQQPPFPAGQAPPPLPQPPVAAAAPRHLPPRAQRRTSGARGSSLGRSQTEAELLTELTDLLWDRGIRLDQPSVLRAFEGSHRLVCPDCGGGRSEEQSLSVTLRRSGAAMWNCFRASCGWSGGVHARGGPALEHGAAPAAAGGPAAVAAAAAPRAGRPPACLPDTSDFQPLPDDLVAWFAARGISHNTLALNRVAMERRFMPGAGGSPGGVVAAIAFPYLKGGEVVNVKYRALPKVWSQTKGGEQILYGIDDIRVSLLAAWLEAMSACQQAEYRCFCSAATLLTPSIPPNPPPLPQGCEEVIIVEGEFDKLALNEAGLRNVASVPSGAVAPKRTAATAPPPSGGGNADAAAAAAAADRRVDAKFAFLRRAEPVLRDARRVVLATDADAPGQALAEELARRLGRARCALLRWPAGCKDANDALLALEPAGLADYVRTAAVPMPPESLV